MNLRFWEKPLRMVWRIEREPHRAHLVGTAHFFPYSYAHAFTRLMREVNTVLFEGPLDEASQARIAEYGKQGEGVPTFVKMLTPEAINAIERILRARLYPSSDTLFLPYEQPIYFESFTHNVRPWAAFFAIWRTYLDWQHSMDMEAYHLALKLGKQTHFLETIEEQVNALDNIPLERIVRQLNDVKNWDSYKNGYLKLFLQGDLDQLMAFTSRFVTRGPSIIGARDRVLFERMLPFIEREPVLVLIGFPHLPGVFELLRQAGYRETQVQV